MHHCTPAGAFFKDSTKKKKKKEKQNNNNKKKTIGAIFTELIPFTETRHYVKAVLSNTVDYATLFSGQPQSLKSWLSTITPQPVGVAQLP